MKVMDVAVSFVLALVGAMLLDLGLELRSDQCPYAHGIVTTATTTSFRTERTPNRSRTMWSTYYRPVYTFQTRTGETTTYDDPIADNLPPKLGRSVVLSYRVNEPAKARVVRGWDGWTTFPIIFTAASILVFASVAYILGYGLIRKLADRTAR